MRRGWKILIAVLAGLAVLLALNTIVLDRETKPAEVTVPGGRILSLNGGDLEVKTFPVISSASRPGMPGFRAGRSTPRVGSRAGRGSPSQARGESSTIVLLHCYTCAINWWDRLIPLLRRRHRVIAIDLLGHGGSEKPSSGYSIPDQADLIAEALDRLGVRGATVVGHSLGGTVATALAQQFPRLVSRLVLIDQAPDNSYGQLSLLARLTYWPVLGEALWRVTPDFAVKDALGQAFAPGYEVPDRFVEDVRQMTFNAYDTVGAEEDDYTKQEPLDARIRAARIPLLAIFGDEDQIYDARRALSAYAAIRGARTDLINGAGHSPNVEKPTRVAKLIGSFAAPEPEPSNRSGEFIRSTTARCQTAIAGPGRADWRRGSSVAGPFGLFGGGRDFSKAQRVGRGSLEAKIPAIVEGHGRVVLRLPEREHGQVGLLWGHTALTGNWRSVRDAFDRVVFLPCTDKPRTVWPGGLLLADRRPIALRVVIGDRTNTVRIG